MKIQTRLILPVALAVAPLAPSRVLAVSPAALPTNTAGAAAQTRSNDSMTALFGNPVIAKGKGFELKRNELDEVMSGVRSSIMARGQKVPPAQLNTIKKKLLDRLILIKILSEKATAADKAKGEQKADEQIQTLVKHAGSQAALERQLSAADMTLDKFRKRAVEEATAQSVLDRELKVNVSAAAMTNFYSAHAAEFEQPEKVRLCDILLLTIDPVTHSALPAGQKEEKHKQIEGLLKQIRGGASFTNLAAQYSEDPNSKADGGVLPPLSREQMAPALAAAAFSMTNNQVSDVIETDYGYYLLKLLDKVQAQKLPFGQVSTNIEHYLVRQQEQKLAPPYFNKLKKEYQVQILDPDLRALEESDTNTPPDEADGN